MFSKDKTIMGDENTIDELVDMDDKNKSFIFKNEDMTCLVRIEKRGIYEGIIETMRSNGRHTIRLTKRLEDL